MIKKLTSKDHNIVWEYLSKEPALNLFLLGDIEAFGYDTSFQELWGDFSQTGELRAVLLRYYESFIPYASGDFNKDGFYMIMKEYNDITLSGKADIVEQFENMEGLLLGKKRRMYFCECKGNQEQYIPDESVRLASLDDVKGIIKLRQQIEDFVVPEDAEERLIQVIQTNTGRVYYVAEEGEIVASAATAAENSKSAMVVAVCTDSEHRKKGYASRILKRMIQDISSEGKTLCLFYDNPEAGSIYKRLGFRDIGQWTMYR